ncbi:MAG: hypothetical protein H0U23_17290 [Blastocatellia bacterium]|nr:hypothetical protein [Blastocatellia bacterium]
MVRITVVAVLILFTALFVGNSGGGEPWGSGRADQRWQIGRIPERHYSIEPIVALTGPMCYLILDGKVRFSEPA